MLLCFAFNVCDITHVITTYAVDLGLCLWLNDVLVWSYMYMLMHLIITGVPRSYGVP